MRTRAGVWMSRWGLGALLALVLCGCAYGLTDPPGATTAAPPAAFTDADPFYDTWARTDQPVADLRAARTWIWGPEPLEAILQEEYREAPSGWRDVRYFDKSRMEITEPGGNPDDLWYVTNGLLATELINGQLQLGHAQFEPRHSAEINVAGDPDDASAPTYATLRPLLHVSPVPDGAPIIQRLARDGRVTNDAGLARYGATAAYRVQAPGLDHQVSSPFWELMHTRGLVWVDGQLVDGPLFTDPFYAIGLPITEAYWTTVRVGGTPRDVLLQCFQRRCLTWTPSNPVGWQVEMGNIGRHYFQWRYLDRPPIEGPTATPTQVPTATVPGTPALITVGPGAVDAWMRSIVRDREDRVWLVAMNNNPAYAGTGPGEVRIYRATTPGVPSAFSEVVPARTAATGTATIPFADAAIDDADRLHIVWVDRSAGQPLWYRVFDLRSEAWHSEPERVDDTGLSGYGGFAGQGGVSVALDADGTVRVAYAYADNHTQIRIRTRVAGNWSVAVEPLRVPGAFVWHPVLVRGPGGWMVMAYDATNRQILGAADDGTGWQSPAVVARAVLGPESIDQGPAALAVPDGPVYVAWLDANSRVRLSRFDGSTWADVPLGSDYVTHAPGLGVYADGTLVIVGHDAHAPPRSVNQLQGTPGAWGAWMPLAAIAADGSHVFRWAGEFSMPGRTSVDLVFFDEDTNDDGVLNDQTLFYVAVPQQ